MLRRGTALLLILFQALLLNVVIPGHTRGIITLSGRSAINDLRDVGWGGCCQKHSGSENQPTQKDRAQCAICHLAARITPAPVVDLRLTELGRGDLFPVSQPRIVTAPDLALTYHGRAPPLV